MQLKNFLSLVFLAFPILVLAQSGPDLKTLVFKAELKSEKPLVIEFTPPAEHHFNQEAPTKVEITAGGAKSPAHLTKTLQKISANFPASVIWDKTSHIFAQLYLCNEKNTYCVPVKQEFEGKDLSLSHVQAQTVTKDAETSEETSTKTEVKSFLMNDPDQALKLAQEQNKMLLIDFFGIWCPPCNMLDENVFRRGDFQKMQSKYVFLKMDVDRPSSFPLKSKYDVKGYPTVVLANSSGEEISRIVGFRQPKSFLQEMQAAILEKNKSFSERVALAESGKSPKEALKLAEMYVNQEDFWKALNYIQLAHPRKSADKFSDAELANLKRLTLSIEIGILKDTAKEAESQKKAFQFVEFAVHSNENLVEAFDWVTYLNHLAEELKDKDLSQRVKNLEIELAESFLQELKNGHDVLSQSELTEADLYSILAEAYAEKDEALSKKNYLLAAEAYKKDIKSAGIPESIERGNNSERAYCLFKGGKGEEALSLYQELEKSYPEEFTFYYYHATVLQELGQKEAALEKAQKAYQYSYGDNQLRVAYLVADLQSKSGKKKEALSLINEVLAKYPVDKTLKIRSSRYVEKLQKLKAQL